MAFFKFLFFVIVFVLIKIGLFVQEKARNLRNLIAVKKNKFSQKLPRFSFAFSPKVSKKRKRGRPRKKNTISLNFSPLLKSVKKITLTVVRIPIYIATLVFIAVRTASVFLWFGFVLILRIIFFPLRIFKRKPKEVVEEVIVVDSKRPSHLLLGIRYILVGILFGVFFICLPVVFYIFISDLPKLSGLSVNAIPKTTKILDRNGQLLFEVYAAQNRTLVSLDQIPKDLQEATIAIEDQDFYHHPGFDIRGIARAAYLNFFKGEHQGGSTITQQLIKSALLTPEPTLIRKSKEIVLAFWAEREYSKDEILELYFNYVPYGGTAWGIEAASQVYFGKSVDSLSLAESAYLAGLPQSPSQYSPFMTDGSAGKRRQQEVLTAMVRDGYVTQAEAEKAYHQPLEFLSPRVPIKAPHFVMYVRDLLEKKYGLSAVEQGGLQVTTTLDSSLQERAQGIVAAQVEENEYLGVGNGAALVTSPSNGDILAMVGSKDYFDVEHDGNVNLTTAKRQPGSTIKLVTYALALTKGYTEASILEDTPLTIRSEGAEPYTPVNYDGRFHGRVPFRIALANSYNIPAVKIAQRVGVEEIVNMGRAMGITSWGDSSNYGVSITLGAAEVSMLELSTVYSTIANDGERVDLNPILEVKDANGTVLEEKTVEPVPVLSPQVAFIMSDILADGRARSLAFGSNSPLTIPNHRVSVKTGTTDNKRDNWTVGFNDKYTVATWVGNNDNTPLSQAFTSGITGAAPMWNKIMTSLLEGTTDEQVIVPEGVVGKNCYGYTAFFVGGVDERSLCRYVAPTPTWQRQ